MKYIALILLFCNVVFSANISFRGIVEGSHTYSPISSGGSGNVDGTGITNLIYSVGANTTNYAQGLFATTQPGNSILTNLAGTGAITNANWTNNYSRILWSGPLNNYASNGLGTIFTNNISAGTLTSTSCVHLLLTCNYLQNSSGNSNFTIFIGYGTSNIYQSAAASFAQSANEGGVRLDIILRNTNAATQIFHGSFGAGQVATATIGYGTITGTTLRSVGEIWGPSGADTTINVPIWVNISNSVIAPAANYVRSTDAILEIY